MQLESYKEKDQFLFTDLDIYLLDPKFCKTTASSEFAEIKIRVSGIFTQVYRVNFILITNLLLFPKPSHFNEEYKHSILILYDNYQFKLLSTENLAGIEKNNSDNKNVYESDNESIRFSLDERNQLIKMTIQDLLKQKSSEIGKI